MQNGRILLHYASEHAKVYKGVPRFTNNKEGSCGINTNIFSKGDICRPKANGKNQKICLDTCG